MKTLSTLLLAKAPLKNHLISNSTTTKRILSTLSLTRSFLTSSYSSNSFSNLKNCKLYIISSSKRTQNSLLLQHEAQKRSFCTNNQDIEKAADAGGSGESASQESFSNKFETSLKYKFKIGQVKLPHYNKRKTGGEDALAFHDGMICVADGVGGWNEMGVDPSKYSNELCENISREYTLFGHKYDYNPKTIFVEAAKKTESQGSSTFCMCALDFEKKYLHTVNMGPLSGWIARRSA